MQNGMSRRVWVAISLIAVVGIIPIDSAAGSTLSIRSTALGKIVVNSKGMTAYFYDLDKPDSGVSACSGQCAVNWPYLPAPGNWRSTADPFTPSLAIRREVQLKVRV